MVSPIHRLSQIASSLGSISISKKLKLGSHSVSLGFLGKDKKTDVKVPSETVEKTYKKHVASNATSKEEVNKTKTRAFVFFKNLIGKSSETKQSASTIQKKTPLSSETEKNILDISFSEDPQNPEKLVKTLLPLMGKNSPLPLTFLQSLPIDRRDTLIDTFFKSKSSEKKLNAYLLEFVKTNPKEVLLLLNASHSPELQKLMGPLIDEPNKTVSQELIKICQNEKSIPEHTNLLFNIPKEKLDAFFTSLWVEDNTKAFKALSKLNTHPQIPAEAENEIHAFLESIAHDLLVQVVIEDAILESYEKKDSATASALLAIAPPSVHENLKGQIPKRFLQEVKAHQEAVEASKQEYRK
ncbi:hypothetical protein [Parachlamydia acanthamoebae]|uniref:hypothetical protein n=1 Tax=Parachlamydia acanthamoebae TaxID=83552 RepID=UPI000750D39D|nr:hypothetical protein [Parachlamydia acanthamoebae]